MGKCRLSCAMFTALAVGLIGPVTSGGLIRVGLRPKRDVCTSRAPYGPPPTTLSARNGARLWSEVSQALEMDILLHIPASDEVSKCSSTSTGQKAHCSRGVRNRDDVVPLTEFEVSCKTQFD